LYLKQDEQMSVTVLHPNRLGSTALWFSCCVAIALFSAASEVWVGGCGGTVCEKNSKEREFECKTAVSLLLYSSVLRKVCEWGNLEARALNIPFPKSHESFSHLLS
jgi:hypothetical protein